MGVTHREHQIILQYEEGIPVDQIANNLGLGMGYVSDRVQQLCVSIGPDLAHRRSMASGSIALLAAINSARRA